MANNNQANPYDGLSQVDFYQMSNREMAKAYDWFASHPAEQDTPEMINQWLMLNRAMDTRNIDWTIFDTGF